jgi:hypothetical protein
LNAAVKMGLGTFEFDLKKVMIPDESITELHRYLDQVWSKSRGRPNPAATSQDRNLALNVWSGSNQLSRVQIKAKS